MISGSFHPAPVSASCRPRRRFGFALTARGIGLLAAGLLLALPGFYSPRLAYSMLPWDALVLLAALWDGLRLPPPHLITVERSWSNAPALDSVTEIELAVTQQSNILLDLRVADDLPAALIETPATHSLSVLPGIRTVLRYSMEPRQRGDVPVGNAFVRYTSALRLVERWAVAPLEQTVRVYPALRPGREQQIFLARSRQIDLQLRQQRQRGLGREFESLREYVEGDDLRNVCWTATARRAQLITRQFQTERSQAVWLVLDAGRLLRGTVQPDQGGVAHSKLDYACSTAVALAQLALYSGDRVGLLVYGRSIQQRLLPNRGVAHLRNIVEALSQARPEAHEADHLRAAALLQRLQPRRALILWVTDLAETAMRPEVIDGALQLLHRHVLMFIAMAQPDVNAIAQSCPRTVEQMFRISAAQELTGRRELLLARLREQGALTLDLDPRRLTAPVLNEYLRVKERAML